MSKCSQCGGSAWTWMGGQRPFQCKGCGYVYCHNCVKDLREKCPRCGGKLVPNSSIPK